jgi:hypothetical protein
MNFFETLELLDNVVVCWKYKRERKGNTIWNLFYKKIFSKQI